MFVESWHILLAAILCDHFYGEYPNRFHPVVWMGQSIRAVESLAMGKGEVWEKRAGYGLAILGPMVWAFLVGLVIGLVPGSMFKASVAVYFLKASFALKALLEAGETVLQSLDKQELDLARDELKSLCSRDASELSQEEVLEASASSLAENLCDSVVAPIFYFMIGGVPLAIAYRMINTLDAMIGYKNHYLHFGYASAKLDDWANWIPARLTALILLIVALLYRKDWQRAYRIALRDHAKTPSPNGGWPMSTMAGILGARFRKRGVYQLGDADRPSDAAMLSEAIFVTRHSGWIYFALTLVGLAA